MATTQKTIVNLTIDQGATFSKTLTVTTDGTTTYNISGLTLQAQLRKSYDSSSASATFTCTIVDGAAGSYKLVLSAADTTALAAGRYIYDVELILADSTYDKVHAGQATVLPEATKI